MDPNQLLVLFWLPVLACGQIPFDDDHIKWNTNVRLPKEATVGQDQLFSSRNYGLIKSDNSLPGMLRSEVSNRRKPTTSSSKLVEKSVQHPKIEDDDDEISEKFEELNRPEKTHSFERFDESEIEKEPENDGGGGGDGGDDDDSFKHVKKLKEMSIISLKPNKHNTALDPISDQQGHAPKRIVRPMRDLSIIVRNRQHPVIVTSRFRPLVPRGHHHKHHHHTPMMPKHKPCKPCKPKVHKKHHHKPKKPKKKPKEHCHHPKPKKPHHKKLRYYARLPVAMNYYYRNRLPSATREPNNNYAIEESLENEEDGQEIEKPFQQQVEDDVEEHRLSELAEPFDDEDPVESTMKAFHTP